MEPKANTRWQGPRHTPCPTVRKCMTVTLSTYCCQFAYLSALGSSWNYFSVHSYINTHIINNKIHVLLRWRLVLFLFSQLYHFFPYQKHHNQKFSISYKKIVSLLPLVHLIFSAYKPWLTVQSQDIIHTFIDWTRVTNMLFKFLGLALIHIRIIADILLPVFCICNLIYVNTWVTIVIWNMETFSQRKFNSNLH